MGRYFGNGHARDCLRDPTRPTYFVPSYSISRALSHENGQALEIAKTVKKVLGSHVRTYQPTEMTLTALEKRKMVERMRDAREHLRPVEARNMALQTREVLSELLIDAPSQLVLPLGRIARFGERKDKLGIEPLGWKGFRARYALRNEYNELLPLGLIVAEPQLAMGVMATSMTHNRRFVADGMARAPHLTIAENPGGIRDHEIREIQEELRAVLPAEVVLDDPVIYLRESRASKETEVMYVRNQTSAAA